MEYDSFNSCPTQDEKENKNNFLRALGRVFWQLKPSRRRVLREMEKQFLFDMTHRLIG